MSVDTDGFREFLAVACDLSGFTEQELSSALEQAEQPELRFDPAGGVVPQDLEKAKLADLITLPLKVPGTNCFNCGYAQRQGEVAYCGHEKVKQWVNERNCCGHWNNGGVRRPWGEAVDFAFDESKHPRVPAGKAGGGEWTSGTGGGAARSVALDPLDLTPASLAPLWEANKREIMDSDPQLTEAAAGSLAAARIFNAVNNRAGEYRAAIDAKVKRGEAITDEEDAKYILAGDIRQHLYDQLVRLSGYRPDKELDQHPQALKPLANSAGPSKREQINKKIEEQYQRNIQDAGLAQVVHLRSDEDKGGFTNLIIHPSAKHPGKWQLSWLDANMVPFGDNTFETFQQALASASGKHFAGVPPLGTREYKVISAKGKRKSPEQLSLDLSQKRTARPGVYLVRHAKTARNTDGNSPDRIRGWDDVPLDATGEKQSEEIAARAAKFGASKLYSSDLKRSKATAQAVADKTGLKPTYRMEFRPWNLGELQGKDAKDAQPVIEQHIQPANRDKKIPGGESFNEFKDRFLTALKEVLEEQAKTGGAVIVVCHYRNLKLAEAWLANGKLDPEIDPDVFLTDDKEVGAIVRAYQQDGKWKCDECSNTKPVDLAIRTGHWVTIGAKGPEGDKHGGVHVYLDDAGRITKGPPQMHGKTPGQVGHIVKAIHGDIEARKPADLSRDGMAENAEFYLRLKAELQRAREQRIDLAFDESKHPRGGHPENTGEFSESAGSGKRKSGTAPPHPGSQHGSSVTLKPSKERAFDGETPVATKTTLSKQETGRVGEAVVLAYLRQILGRKDARPMNTSQSNFAVDLIEDHAPTEVKAGLVSNGRDAQKWRLTFSKESAAEIAAYDKMTPEQRTRWNLKKQQRIHQRKLAVIRALEEETGKKVKPRTMTVVINPDTRTADIYLFDGWYDIIRWYSPEAKKAYKGSVTYA